MLYAPCAKSLNSFFIKSAIFFMNNPSQHKFRIPQSLPEAGRHNPHLNTANFLWMTPLDPKYHNSSPINHMSQAESFENHDLKISSISLSEKPTAFSLSLSSFFSSSFALRARPISAIVSIEVTKQPGF